MEIVKFVKDTIASNKESWSNINTIIILLRMGSLENKIYLNNIAKSDIL